MEMHYRLNEFQNFLQNLALDAHDGLYQKSTLAFIRHCSRIGGNDILAIDKGGNLPEKVENHWFRSTEHDNLRIEPFPIVGPTLFISTLDPSLLPPLVLSPTTLSYISFSLLFFSLLSPSLPFSYAFARHWRGKPFRFQKGIERYCGQTLKKDNVMLIWANI